jgi:hypothetical protein
MALFMSEASVARLRGFDNAAPEGWVLSVVNQASQTLVAEVNADARGRFDVEFPAETDEGFEIRPHLGSEGAIPLVFQARVREAAIPWMLRGRIAGTGSTPNQLLFAMDAPHQGPSHAFVVLSGDNAFDNMDVDSGSRGFPLAAFSDETDALGPVPAAPWSAVVNAERAYVTLYAQRSVAMVDVAAGTAVTTARPQSPVVLVEPMTLEPPADSDGDGATESLATALLPRTPTGIALTHSALAVAYANVMSTSEAGHAQYGPGMLAVFPLTGDGGLRGDVRVVITQFRNPQHVLALAGGRVVVSAPGELQRENGVWLAASDGGLEVYDVESLALTRAISLGRFAPSKPVLLPGETSVYVPSILRAQVMRADLETSATNGPILLETSDELRTVFECVSHLSGLVFCGIFDSDALVVVDSLDDTVRPWPFLEDISLGGGSPALRHGVQSLALRPGRNGVDRAGHDLLVLMSLASRVVALDTRFVMGP